MRQEEIARFLDEDIGYGDITTDAVVPAGLKAKGIIRAEEDCIIAGVEEAKEIFESGDLDVSVHINDGGRAKSGDTVIEVRGDAKPMLTLERLALNFLMRMSGIATMTSRMLELGREVNPEIRVAGTRKTTPGFRYFEKKAILLGGGTTHRFRLDDGILIKDNHIIAAGGVKEALRLAKERSDFTRKIEIEVTDTEIARVAAENGADIIMLDNFTPEKAAEARRVIKEIEPRILIEISGGMNLANILAYAPYADIISSGALTHSARAANLSMDIILENK